MPKKTLPTTARKLRSRKFSIALTPEQEHLREILELEAKIEATRPGLLPFSLGLRYVNLHTLTREAFISDPRHYYRQKVVFTSLFGRPPELDEAARGLWTYLKPFATAYAYAQEE